MITTLTQEDLNNRLNAKADKAMGHWLSDQHWNLYFLPTFREPVSEEFARRTGELFVATLGPKAYAALAIGRGDGGHVNMHMLLGGLWHGKARKHRNAAIVHATALWRHGLIKKIEPYDHTRKASRYLADHHVVWPIGPIRRHYMKR